MTSPMPLAAVLLDLDGVVRFFPPDDEAAACAVAGLAPGTVAGTAFRPALLTPAVTGLVDDEDWRAQVAQTLAAEHRLAPAIAAEAVRVWSRSAGEVEPTALRAVEQWRRAGRVVVLLTNATSRLPADLERLGLTGAFDAVVSSARTGVAKPDPGAFAAALDAAGSLVGRALHPAEVMLVDDSAANVHAARALGLLGYQAVTRGLLPG